MFGELYVFYLVEYFVLLISSVFEFVDEVYFHFIEVVFV